MKDRNGHSGSGHTFWNLKFVRSHTDYQFVVFKCYEDESFSTIKVSLLLGKHEWDRIN